MNFLKKMSLAKSGLSVMLQSCKAMFDAFCIPVMSQCVNDESVFNPIAVTANVFSTKINEHPVTGQVLGTFAYYAIKSSSQQLSGGC